MKSSEILPAQQWLAADQRPVIVSYSASARPLAAEAWSLGHQQFF